MRFCAPWTGSGRPSPDQLRRASITKSFNRAMAHKPTERALSPGRGRIAHPACLLLLHSRQGNHLISALGRRGGSGSPRCPDAMLSPSPFPMQICRPGPVSGILSGAAISSNALSRRHHSPRPQPRPTGGAVAKPRAADLRTVHGHTKKEK